MHFTGNTSGRLAAAVFFLLCASTAGADSPPEPTPRASSRHLGTLGSQVVLDQTALGRTDGTVTIDNQTVERLRSSGRLTICRPGNSLPTAASGGRDAHRISDREIAKRNKSEPLSEETSVRTTRELQPRPDGASVSPIPGWRPSTISADVISEMVLATTSDAVAAMVSRWGPAARPPRAR